MAKKLNFNIEKHYRIPIAPIDRALGRKMGDFEVSEGINPWIPSYPFKYLPVMIIDNSSKYGTVDLREGIVLPKGTIVSSFTNQTEIFGGSTPMLSGIPDPVTSGTIPAYDDATTAATDWVSVNIDQSPFGYEDHIISLLVPANGGYQSNIPYSTLDDDVDGWNTSSSDDLAIGANYPVGVVYTDVYQDVRGKYLNHQKRDVYGYACRGFISVPYVDTDLISDFGNSDDVNHATQDTTTVYNDVWKKFAFLYGTDIHSGLYVQSDHFGKFVLTGFNDGVTSTGTTALNALGTRQIVGQVKACDSRFPKSDSDLVITYTGTEMGVGTETAGIPTDLYAFAKTVVQNSSDATYGTAGTAPTATQVLTAIQAGAIGQVKIQLML